MVEMIYITRLSSGSISISYDQISRSSGLEFQARNAPELMNAI